MKKLFTFTLAAATLIGFSACSNDEENVLSDKGYINLGVTIDNTLATRATQDATVADWYAVVTNGDGDAVFGTLATKALIGTTLATTPLNKGSYNVAVANFADDDDWLTANGGFGAAYYEGSADNQEVKAGETKEVSISCGKSQNAKFSIASGGFNGSALKVDVTSPRTLSFDKACTTIGTPTNTAPINTDAFFAPKAELTYTITYTINGINKTSTAKTITLGDAGSASTLTISSDSNGKLSVITITYNDEYGKGNNQEIEINGATGNENP